MKAAFYMLILGVLATTLLSVSEANAGNADNELSEAVDAAEQGNCHKAFSLLAKAKKKAPEDYQVYFMTGTTHLRCGKPKQAKPYLEKGINLAEHMAVQDRYTKGDIATSYALLGNFSKAKIYGEEAIKLFNEAGDTNRANRMKALLLDIQNR